MRLFLNLLGAVSAMAGLAMLPSMAKADEKPAISAELIVEWQNDYRAHSDDAAVDETNNSFARSELAPTIRLNEHFFIDGVLVLEPFDQAETINANDDIWFDREGVFTEEIKLNFEYGPYRIWAGKFNPGFGTAWDFGRGIWSEDFAEDYEITEKLGGGIAYTYEADGVGAHTLSGSTFFSDTSFLSRGLITGRDRTKLTDGKAGNTENLSSFTLSLDGEKLAGVENLKYHLGYRFLGEQEKNRSTTTEDESGLAAMLGYVVPVNDNLSFDLLGEYAGLHNFEGTKNSDRDYYTSSVVATLYSDWNVSVGYTKRDIADDGNGASFNDHLFQFSGGYNFGNGLTAEAGWKATKVENQNADTLGFLLRYRREFN